MNSVIVSPKPTVDITVERGRRAYQQIKKDAQTMRENWRAVGEALLVGRKANPSNKAFGDWCLEQGFDMDARVRSDAMWLVDNWGVFQRLEDGGCHPTGIRQAYNESLKSILPSDLSDITPEPTIELDERSAEKVVKLARRSQSGDEGSEIAKRHFEALAKKHDTTPEKLEKAAARKVPLFYHNLTPIQIQAGMEIAQNMKEAYDDLVQDNFDPVVAKALLQYAVDQL